jgi:hypothetical protein
VSFERRCDVPSATPSPSAREGLRGGYRKAAAPHRIAIVYVYGPQLLEKIGCYDHLEAFILIRFVLLFRFIQNQAQRGPASPGSDGNPDRQVGLGVLEMLQKLFPSLFGYFYHEKSSVKDGLKSLMQSIAERFSGW